MDQQKLGRSLEPLARVLVERTVASRFESWGPTPSNPVAKFSRHAHLWVRNWLQLAAESTTRARVLLRARLAAKRPLGGHRERMHSDVKQRARNSGRG